MAEYLIQEETLTAIANAIRAKTETTAKMKPTSMAALIEEIGGLPDGIETFAFGSFTQSSSSANLDITHNLGVVPHFILLVPADISKPSYTSSSNMGIAIYLGYYSEANSFHRKMVMYKSGSSGFSVYSEANSTAPTATKYNIQSSYTARKYQSGVQYLWMCGTFKDFV